ncbi:MAG: hypothetical protein CMD26_06390 [Flavobacteriales bacterium]|nr:hypothetical protein [Flavobacteriales bacterium]|tara:strand:- start:1 stop:429 length:429 start_codon:yes stop_codon:yes gene_type:complete
MKYIILLFFPIISYCQEVQYQNLFIQSVYDKKKCELLLSYCKDHASSVQKAYFGAALILQSKHAKSIYKKWKSFKDGKKILEEAVEENIESSEIRFLRYCIQKGIPDFLNYSQNTKEDSIFIHKNGTNKEKDSIIKLKMNKL